VSAHLQHSDARDQPGDQLILVRPLLDFALQVVFNAAHAARQTHHAREKHDQ
jgi:hypothetical protein